MLPHSIKQIILFNNRHISKYHKRDSFFNHKRITQQLILITQKVPATTTYTIFSQTILF